MNRTSKTATRIFLLGASLFFSVSLLANPQQPSDPQRPAADNSKMNQRDRDKDSATADQQKMNSADRDITKKIRRAIYKDKSLSTYAHNIKIITQDGKVTLKGPVRTEEEKSNVEAKAAAVAGQDNVTSQIEVAPSK